MTRPRLLKLATERPNELSGSSGDATLDRHVVSAQGHTASEGAPPTLRFDEYELDFARRELSCGGTVVDLQPTPLRVLLHLALHRDRVVPRRELLDAIWPGVVVGDEALTTALAEARRAVCDDGAAQRVVRTLKGRGYRFAAEARTMKPCTSAAGTHARAARDGWSVPLGGWGLFVAAVVLVTGAVLLRECGALGAKESAQIRSIAVLPLANLSGDSRQDHFAAAMTEALIGELAKLPEVRVTSRTSILRFEDSNQPLRDIAGELGVDGIVEGTVLHAGEEVRISAQLIDARSDRHVWGEHYDREIGRVLETQGEVASAVADAIEVALSSERSRSVLAREQRVVSGTARGIVHR